MGKSTMASSRLFPRKDRRARTIASGRPIATVTTRLTAVVPRLSHSAVRTSGLATAIALCNHVLGNTGETVRYHEPAVFEAGGATHDLAVLARELHEGSVRVLVMLGWNPEPSSAPSSTIAVGPGWIGVRGTF